MRTDDAEGAEKELRFVSALRPFRAGKRQLEQTVLSADTAASSPVDWNLEVECWQFKHE